MDEQLWLDDDICVPVEYFDNEGYPIFSEFLGYNDGGKEVWIKR